MSGNHKDADVARRIRARCLTEGKPVGEIARLLHEECGQRYGTSWVKAHRLAHGLALADVVEQVKAWYELEGKPEPKLSDTLISAYESGYKRPGAEYLHYLCLVYQTEPDNLGFEGPCVCGRAHRAATAVEYRADPNSTPTASCTPAVYPRSGVFAQGEEEEEDDVLRRTLLQLLAGAGVTLDGQFLGAVDGVRRRMHDTLGATNVSPTTLDQLEETTYGYGRQYMSLPPLRMLCDVLLDFSEVRRMCEYRQSVEVQERLCRIAAQLAGLSGIILIDLGDQRLSRSFFRTARIAADDTGDRALRAWVTVREALVPYYHGDPTEALQLARRSQDLAGRTPCAAATMAPVLEARALGQLARRGRTDVTEPARRALARGTESFAQLPVDHTRDTAFGYTERQLIFHEGNTRASLGDQQQADELLQRALTRYPESELLDRTLIRFDHAACRVRTGEIEEALRIGRGALLDLPSGHRTDIVVGRARELDEVASRHNGLPAAREFREVLALAPADGRD